MDFQTTTLFYFFNQDGQPFERDQPSSRGSVLLYLADVCLPDDLRDRSHAPRSGNRASADHLCAEESAPGRRLMGMLRAKSAMSQRITKGVS